MWVIGKPILISSFLTSCSENELGSSGEELFLRESKRMKLDFVVC